MTKVVYKNLQQFTETNFFRSVSDTDSSVDWGGFYSVFDGIDANISNPERAAIHVTFHQVSQVQLKQNQIFV